MSFTNTSTVPLSKSTYLTYDDCKRLGNTLAYLPKELRDMVYALVISSFPSQTHSLNIALVYGTELATALQDPELFRPHALPDVCQIFPEAIPAYLKTVSFYIPSDSGNDITPAMMKLLQDIYGIDGFPYVRNLKIRYPWLSDPPFPTISKTNLEILERCTELRSLTIALRATCYVENVELNIKDLEPNEDIYAMLQRACGLSYLYRLEKLERFELLVDLNVPTNLHRFKYSFTMEATKWLEKQFTDNGKSIDVQCKSVRHVIRQKR